jgi:hypothetical protein
MKIRYIAIAAGIAMYWFFPVQTPIVALLITFCAFLYTLKQESEDLFYYSGVRKPNLILFFLFNVIFALIGWKFIEFVAMFILTFMAGTIVAILAVAAIALIVLAIGKVFSLTKAYW